MEDIIIKKEQLPIEFQSNEEIKSLCLFLVKEIYGDYAASAEIFVDVDGLWILFLRDKKCVYSVGESIKEIYDGLLEEYEGYVLYSISVRDQNQFSSAELN